MAHGIVCSGQSQGQGQYSRPVELSSYGDGLLWGAGLLLHLLKQAAWFKLTDLSSLVVQRQQLEYRSTGDGSVLWHELPGMPPQLACLVTCQQNRKSSEHVVVSVQDPLVKLMNKAQCMASQVQCLHCIGEYQR